MNRRTFLKVVGSAALLPVLPHNLLADSTIRRVRPGDPGWPSADAWKRLNEAVGGNLIPVNSPLSILKANPESAEAKQIWKDLKNPYYVRDQAGLTETSGWLDAWSSQPSVYAVQARNAQDIAAAVNFARENNLRLAVKGGGHSYQGTSNAPDSLLIWTRQMHDIEMHDAFVPQGCQGTIQPVPAVTVGAGTIGMQAYDAVMVKGGKYVQGGGCMTVCLGGLIAGGGFGSFSKHYGTAAGSLLEAEVITADGQIRTANACTNSDLYWALKGGGGGTFGVVSKMTVRVHELPEWFATANFRVQAPSDEAYHRLIRKFVSFYKENIFNDHWGEQFHLRPSNELEIAMLAHGLNGEQAQQVWKPFLEWVKSSPDGYSLKHPVAIGGIPARHFWEAQWWNEHWPEIAFPRTNFMLGLLDDALVHVAQPVIRPDDRTGARPGDYLWAGNVGECSWFIWGYESLWLPDSLLENDEQQQRLADALFAASRISAMELHCNKGLGGAPAEAIALAKDTATNPSVLSAFALAIVADGQGPSYPGVPGHEPAADEGKKSAERIDRCVDELRKVAPNGGAYCSESNYFEKGFQQAYWGDNYARLLEIKKKYDPNGLFIVHNGVGSEGWSRDGFTKA